jgi:hypothetical protein
LKIIQELWGYSARIAAGALADPFTDAAKELGYKGIADLAAIGLEFPYVGIAVKKSYVRDNMDTRVAFPARLHRSHRDLIQITAIDRPVAVLMAGALTFRKSEAQ